MYKRKSNQISVFEDPTMFGGIPVNPENEWVKLAKLIPWVAFEEKYSEQFPSNTGQPADSLSVALGSQIIKEKEDLATLTATDVTVLDNEWKSITVDGKEVILAGLTSRYVTDYRAFRAESGSSDRYPRQENISGIGGAVHARDHKPETAWLSALTAQTGFHILLSHHPEYLPLIPSSIELVLSGRAHGGQWRVFNHGVWAPGQGYWPKWTRGVYEERLVVSAGLSNTTWYQGFGIRQRLCMWSEKSHHFLFASQAITIQTDKSKKSRNFTLRIFSYSVSS